MDFVVEAPKSQQETFASGRVDWKLSVESGYRPDTDLCGIWTSSLKHQKVNRDFLLGELDSKASMVRVYLYTPASEATKANRDFRLGEVDWKASVYRVSLYTPAFSDYGPRR